MPAAGYSIDTRFGYKLILRGLAILSLNFAKYSSKVFDSFSFSGVQAINKSASGGLRELCVSNKT